jgi:integrase
MKVLSKKNINKVTLSTSFNGYEFDYLKDKWVLSRNVTLNINFLVKLRKGLSDDVREALVYFAENNSAHHVRNISKQLKLFQSKTNSVEFSEEAFLNFKNYLSKKDEYKLSVIRGFIRQMRYLGLDGHIDDGVYELTDQWSLSGNEKGVAVLSLDPETGPFSSMEFEAIGHNSAHKFAEGELTTERYAILLLYKATGRRSEQLACLKVQDFSLSNKHTGKPTYVVNIPRIKQRGRRFRTIFKPFGLVTFIGQVIEQHIKDLIEKVERELGRKLSLFEVDELPLFMTNKEIKELKRLTKSDLLEYLKLEVFHITSSAIGSRLITAVNQLKVVSERTGKLIHVSPYRFRYTLGTRAAIEGAGILTIATLLDHTNDKNVDVYVANVPEHAVEISKIMNQPLARYASAFAGKLVQGEEEANQENFGAARISLREEDCDVGSCGTSTFCQDFAPIACYLCPKFRPWEDAPHHLVLKWLMEEREKLKKEINKDMMIVSINDRAIVAVCQVIKIVEENRNV